MRASRSCAWLAVALAGCTATTAPPPAESDLPPPAIISDSIALPAGCDMAKPPFHPGEPSLAAAATNPRLLVAAWQQLGSPVGAGNVVAVSRDGGGHWAQTLLPGLTRCSGGIYASATDPWVSIGSDNVISVASLMTRPPADGATGHDIIVSVSRDAGASWQQPVVVETVPAPPTLPDKEAILADPHRPGSAYLTWAEYGTVEGADPSVDQVYFSRTADGGGSWSKPTPIYSGGDEAQQNQLLMMADGTLVDVFVEGSSLPGGPHPPELPVAIRVIRSRDQGQTWGAPIDAARFIYTNATDPGNGGQLRFFGQDITATAAGNAIYVSWFVNHPAESTIWVSRSEDRGLHWSAARAVVRQRPEAFLPTLAVAGDATVGMLWFDFRHYKTGSQILDTDVWFSSSRDRGAHWTVRHAGGPFDLRSAPAARFGPFIGDYMGLVGLPDGFGAAFVQAKPLARNGPTDVFFLKIAR
jgi:hypothetical protein